MPEAFAETAPRVAMRDPIDTLNRFGVAHARKDSVVVLNPPKITAIGTGPVLSKAEALNLAAYLVLVLDAEDEFAATVAAIKSA